MIAALYSNPNQNDDTETYSQETHLHDMMTFLRTFLISKSYTKLLSMREELYAYEII